MEIRKADSKGRITAGKKGLNYYVEETEGGSITLIPVPDRDGLRIIETKPGEGKTTRLIRIMLEPGNEDVIYVAPTLAQAKQAFELAWNMTAWPIGSDLKSRFRKYDPHISLPAGSRIVVDEVGGVIDWAFGAKVLAVAGTDSMNKAKWLADRSGR